MSTPQRRALRPLYSPNQAPPTIPSASPSPNKSLHPHPLPSLSPSTGKENLLHPSPSTPSPRRRPTRPHVMRLAELMASVAMTPIKEWEEEEGLGLAPVEFNAWGAGEEGKRGQEEEILRYQAILREEEEEAEEEARLREERQPQEGGEDGSDGFHSADEGDFKWAEEEEQPVTDSRRSSLPLLVASPPKPPTQGQEEVEQSPAGEEDEDSSPPLLLDDPSSDTAEGEEDVQPLSTPRPKRVGCAPGCIVDPSSPPSPSSDPLPMPSLLSPLPPAHPPTPTPCSSCPFCSSLFLSLQHWQAEAEALQCHVHTLTDDGFRLYAEYERKSVRVREMTVQAEQREVEEEQRRRKEDDDYRSLYFAYVRLEAEHNALQAAAYPPAAAEVVEQEGVEDDYAAMVEEKLRSSPSIPSPDPPSPPSTSHTPLLPLPPADVERLQAEVAHLQSQLQCSTAQAEAYRSKYDELLTLYSSQAGMWGGVVGVLDVMEEVDRMQGEVDEGRLGEVLTARLTAVQAEGRVREVEEELRSMIEQRDGLTASLTDLRDTYEYVQAEKTANEEELSDLKRSLTAQQQRLDALTAEHAALLRVHRGVEGEGVAVRADLAAQRVVGRNWGMALRAAQATVEVVWEEGERRGVALGEAVREVEGLRGEVVREREGRERVEREAGEREEALRREIRGVEERRAVVDARLRSSEEQVQSLTLAMATLDPRQRPIPDASHASRSPPQASAELLHLQQKYTALVEQCRAMSGELSQLQAELASVRQREGRVRVGLGEEREARERAEGERRRAEEEVRRCRDEVGEWEGRWEAMQGKVRERGREREEAERRLQEREQTIARLTRTVREMHRHIEGEGREQLHRLKATIQQHQQVLAHVVAVLRRDEFRDNGEVQAMLALLDHGRGTRRGGSKDSRDNNDRDDNEAEQSMSNSSTWSRASPTS